MTPFRQDFTIVQGADFQRDIEVFQSDGVTPFDVTGWTAAWEIRGSLTGPQLVRKTGAPGVELTAGHCALALTAAETEALAIRNGLHHLTFTRTSDGVVVRYLEGAITVDPDFTATP